MPISPEYMTIAAVGVLLLGIIVGAIAARIVLPSRRQLRRLSSELEALRAEHAAYRTNVTRHFETTSGLVANMTASYKAVYDHLAAGAQSLCDGSKALEAGEFGAPRLVFDPRVDVERLGAESARTPGEAPVAQSPASPAAEPASNREEGPVLEMTKSTNAETPATGEPSTRQQNEGDDDARPSIH